MNPTYQQYLDDENLPEELVRRAHLERAEAMHRFLAQSAAALRTGLRPAPAPQVRTDACG
jgi:hypothetical protein